MSSHLRIIFLLNPALQDVLTGDEIISDSFDLKEIDGIVYEADCAMITEGAVQVGPYTLPAPCILRDRLIPRRNARQG